MIKRYTPGIEQSHPELEAVAFMMEAKHGECVMYADHAAFVAQVREVAEGMEHDESCDAYDYDDFDYDEYGSPAEMFKPKCRPAVCTRGKLLALCARGGEHG